MIFQSKWFTHPRFQEASTGVGVIKYGESGEAVKVLQSALIELGHAMPISLKKNGTPDGIFGSETDGCVKAFQRKALPSESADGKVGPKTLAQLDSRLVSKPAPKGGSVVWGDAPPGIPGTPNEADLGTSMGPFQAIHQHHDMACWAACLSYWGKHCGGGRPKVSQGRLAPLYDHLVQTEGPLTGGMPTGGLRQILEDKATPQNVLDPSELTMKWKAQVFEMSDTSTLTYDWLKRNASGFGNAIYFGYTIGGASHINVIGYYELEETPYVWAMEPWVGRFKLRDIEYYQSSTRTIFAVPWG